MDDVVEEEHDAVKTDVVTMGNSFTSSMEV
jgi:hypothetical protein